MPINDDEPYDQKLWPANGVVYVSRKARHGIIKPPGVNPNMVRVAVWNEDEYRWVISAYRQSTAHQQIWKCKHLELGTVETRREHIYPCSNVHHEVVPDPNTTPTTPTITYDLNKENSMKNIYAHVVRTKAGHVGQVLMSDRNSASPTVQTDEILWESEPVENDEKNDEGTVVRSADSIARNHAEEHIADSFRWLFGADTPDNEK